MVSSLEESKGVVVEQEGLTGCKVRLRGLSDLEGAEGQDIWEVVGWGGAGEAGVLWVGVEEGGKRGCFARFS